MPSASLGPCTLSLRQLRALPTKAGEISGLMSAAGAGLAARRVDRPR